MKMFFRAFTTAGTIASRRDPVLLNFIRTPASQPHPEKHLPPIVLLHGMMASESTYRSVQKRSDFASQREKIGVDLCNHGLSPRLEADDMSYPTMADDVISLLDSLHIRTACLIGHSMGGKVAMQAALTHPQRVSELVVVDIAPVTYSARSDPSDPPVAAHAMAKIDLRSVQSRNDVDKLLSQSGVASQSVRQFLLTNLVRNDDKGDKDAPLYRWKTNVNAVVDALPRLMAFPDQRGAIYSGKTCIIRGGKSTYVPFKVMPTFTKLFPNAKLVTISEAGHWVQAQMPDQFCRAVNDFLGD